MISPRYFFHRASRAARRGIRANERYDGSRCNITPPAMATSFFEHVTSRPRGGDGDGSWNGGRSGQEEPRPRGKRSGIVVENCPVAARLALERFRVPDFAPKYIDFRFCPPGERKYRPLARGGRGREGRSGGMEEEGNVNELPRMNENFVP